MSTVDAAIINHITNGGSSGGGGGTGVSYTAGDAISLTNNQISVKYDTTTMELKNGALSAKVSSSGGSGGTTIHPGDGLRLDVNNYMHVDYDSSTMTIQDGKLKALIFSGGNVPAEDVLTRSSQHQTGTFSGNIYKVDLGYDKSELSSGNVLRLRNRSGQIDSFIIVRFGSISTSKDKNTMLINMSTKAAFQASIYQDGQDYYMEINCEAGSYDEYASINTDLGIFLNEQMSYSTLCTVVRYLNYPK